MLDDFGRVRQSLERVFHRFRQTGQVPMAAELDTAASAGPLPGLVAFAVVSVRKQIIHTGRIECPGELHKILGG